MDTYYYAGESAGLEPFLAFIGISFENDFKNSVV